MLRQAIDELNQDADETHPFVVYLYAKHARGTVGRTLRRLKVQDFTYFSRQRAMDTFGVSRREADPQFRGTMTVDQAKAFEQETAELADIEFYLDIPEWSVDYDKF